MLVILSRCVALGIGSMWKRKKNKSADRLPRMGMRGRLILAFAVFAVIVIGLLWLFQTVWIDNLYEAVKYRELSKCAAGIEESIQANPTEENLQEAAAALSEKYNICLSIYQIRQGFGTIITDQHTNMFCILHSLFSSKTLNGIYQDIQNFEKPYVEEVSLADYFRDSVHATSDAAPPEEFSPAQNSEKDRTRSVIYADVVTLPDKSSTYLFLLNTEIVPLASTTTTLQLQLILLSVLLAVLVVVIGLVVSTRLSKPLTAMCREANLLSMGNYNVNFNGGNCRETAQLSEALNRAAYELSLLDKMQKDLVANISHDLRTPLTMIAGYSEVIRDLPGEATPENMQIIIDETHRLTSLVNDMLEVSRYQNGSQSLHLSRFNFTDTLGVTLQRYAKLREKEGYTFQLEADCDVWVEADETRILQVLYNLINNAVNYTGEDKTVIIRQKISGKEVTLSVIDTGVGIPPEHLPMVWERYYKVHDYHKRANMGTGLGLSIVKNILVLHNASFGVNSTLGKGSVFWFSLPIAEPNPDTPLEEDNIQ